MSDNEAKNGITFTNLRTGDSAVGYNKRYMTQNIKFSRRVWWKPWTWLKRATVYEIGVDWAITIPDELGHELGDEIIAEYETTWE